MLEILLPHTNIQMPSNDPDLGGAKKGAGSSAFVLSAVRLGIPALPSIINACILTSAWSCGLANCFTSSRLLYSLALRGQAPRFFLKTWRGVPYWTIIVVNAIGCLSFLSLGEGGSATAFSWLVNILGALFIFGLILTHIVYLRFRAGVAAQGLDRSNFPYFIKHQSICSWIALVGYSIIFLVSQDVSCSSFKY
jgi:amino acid transporter